MARGAALCLEFAWRGSVYGGSLKGLVPRQVNAKDDGPCAGGLMKKYFGS